METTERIVEAYVRHVKGWFTLANLRCAGQKEIDLLAVEVRDGGVVGRYHIESGVSISGAFSDLTAKPFSLVELRERIQQPAQRRTLAYFEEHKFNPPPVVRKLGEFGFHPGNYTKIVVSWGWKGDVPQAAKARAITLWDFKDILLEIAAACRGRRTYFTDDTMRTLHLMVRAVETEERKKRLSKRRAS